MDATAAAAIVALFAPLIVSILKQTGLPSSVNGFIAIVVYIVFGVGACVTSGQPLDLNNITPFVTIFVTVGTAAYMAFWRNTGLETALTTSTSVINGAPAPNPPQP
jgi:Na+/glutamate symporter